MDRDVMARLLYEARSAHASKDVPDAETYSWENLPDLFKAAELAAADAAIRECCKAAEIGHNEGFENGYYVAQHPKVIAGPLSTWRDSETRKQWGN